MKRLTVDALRDVLPDLDELRPLADRLLAESEPDPARTWSGSGALASIGDRLVEADGLTRDAAALAEEEHAHRTRIYGLVAQAVQDVADGEDSSAAERLLEAAALEEERDRPHHAEAYADAACRTAADGGAATIRARALRRRGRHRRTLGRYGAAVRDYEEAALVAESVDDVRGAAEALVGWGNVLEEQGRWEESADRYRRARAVLEALDEPVAELWHAELNLHVVLRTVGRLEDSLPPLRRAEDAAAAVGDASATVFIENARGQLEMARGDFQAAEGHLRRALGASDRARAEITIRLNLAETLLARGRTLDAAEEARRAERQAILARLPQKLPEVYRLLGRVATAEGVTDAFVLFERALQIIEERQLPELERAQTLQAYAEAEDRLGDAEKSAALMNQADSIYQTLGIENRRRPWADRFDDGSGPEAANDKKGTRDG